MPSRLFDSPHSKAVGPPSVGRTHGRPCGINAHVVEHLLAPVVSAFVVSHVDPVELLREVRDDVVLAYHPAHVLDVIANRIKAGRKKCGAP
jgi:hypothetical protein